MANNYSFIAGGSIWHSDLSYMAYPSRCSLLYAIDVPDDGGDTEWANMYLAYDNLPNELKKRNQTIVTHPPVNETLQLIGEKKDGMPEIKFTHLNHTNPLNNESSDENKILINMGWNVSKEGESFNL